MSAIEILPFILFIVVIVTAIAERINVPYPLLLVVAGLIVGFIPGIPNWHPPSELVLPLFLPPILFAAARTISWRDVRNNVGTIMSLSIVLVLITTFSIAGILNFSIPNLSLSTALVLGAIISPTDTVAATAILSKMNVRQNIIRTIEVESLFNDATGIVLYKTAILFVALGAFNMAHITSRTLMVGIGGIAIGLTFSYFTSLIIEQFLTDSENELPIIMSLILAYVAYLFADRLGVSGVLAVVAAGLYHKKSEHIIEARTRLSETTVWRTLIFFLNGIIFITIGIQFPSYLHKVSYLPTSHILFFSFSTIIALLFLRFVWVTFNTYLPYLIAHLQKKKSALPKNPYKKVLIVSWAGMRGLVPLALALAIPATIGNKIPFPNRDLIIFLTIVTILFTLLAQGLTLPYMIRKLGAGKDDKRELKNISKIYKRLTNDTMNSINQWTEKNDRYSKDAVKLVEQYYETRQLQYSRPTITDLERHEIGREAIKLLSKILEHERELLMEMCTAGEISEEIFIKVLRKLDQDEVGFASYK